jgi:hypothetical protein
VTRDRFGDRADMVRRRAAAAADDVDEAGRGELADLRGHRLRAFVVLAEFVGQAGVRIGADQRVGDAADLGEMRAQILGAERAIEADGERAAWRTEFQNAVGVWPDSVRPERSVMVPEIITGTSMPRSANSSARRRRSRPWR